MNPLQCSETMSTGKINCAKGKEKNPHILHDFGKFSFSVWLHCTLALCSGLPALQVQAVREQWGTYQGRVGGIATAFGPHKLQGLQLSLTLKGHQESPA